jgi:transposase
MALWLRLCARSSSTPISVSRALGFEMTAPGLGHPFDAGAYRQRNLIERMFCRLKDWRRVATRYDKLAANFAAAVALAAVIIWWT